MGVATFRRLLGFLRPYRTGVSWSFVLAGLAMGTGVLIPYLVGRTVDEIRKGRVNLWPLAGAILAAATLRFALSAARRLVAGRVSLGVEFDLRNRVYSHLQSLELAFFDEQQTGQLMSRSTVDLQSVRFFLGYGLLFMAQSALTILIAAAVMFAVNPSLAAVTLAPTPFVIWVAFVYGKKNRPASQEVQQRIAELTAEAEENVSGVRVVKAFAQEERQLTRFRGSVKRVFDQSMISTRLSAFYSPLLAFLPNLGLAALMFVGGRQAIHGTITVGDFVAFYGYVMLLTGPMRMLGIALGMAQRAVASGARVFEVLDAARRAGAEEFIDDLPEGYETRIGERGYTLSGGQRQRIAIARALLKDPRILILDDATSSVDATTESRITRALNELTRGRTTFIIAHRLSTIALADEIVVLEEGRIAAQGSHDELIESSDL